jgi:hypothetical protein
MLANKLREKMGARNGAGEGAQQQGDSDDAMVLSDTTNTPNDDQPVRQATAHTRIAEATSPSTTWLSVLLFCSVCLRMFAFAFVLVLVFVTVCVLIAEYLRAPHSIRRAHCQHRTHISKGESQHSDSRYLALFLPHCTG